MSWLVTFVFSPSSTVSLRIATFVLRSTSLGNATTSLEKHTHLTHRSRINSSITGHEFFSRLTHFDNFACQPFPRRDDSTMRGYVSTGGEDWFFREDRSAAMFLRAEGIPFPGEIKRTFRNRRCTWGVVAGHSLNRERYVHRANVNGRYSLTSSYLPTVSTGWHRRVHALTENRINLTFCYTVLWICPASHKG